MRPGMSGPQLPLSLLLANAEQRGPTAALIKGELCLSYADLLGRVKRRAGYFAKQGASAGTRVALYCDDDVEFYVSLYAIWSLGAVGIPMPLTQTAAKLELIESIVPPDLGFTAPDDAPDHARDFPLAPLGEDEAVSSMAEVEGEALAVIMFTSGTSGVPKAVPLTHQALGHNAWETAAKLGLDASDRLLINSPPFYTSPIIHLLTLFSHGGSVAIDRGLLFGTTLLDLLETHRCTGFGGVPVHFLRLLAALEEGVGAPETLRFLMNSGEHLPRPVLGGIRRCLPGVAFHCVYGLTEVAGRLCLLEAALADEKPGSVGRPLRGMHVAIRNEAGEELPTRQEGQVFVQGPCLMSGYLGNPAATAAALGPHGFATGDLGYLDDEGYLYLLGRQDDIIKVGGEKVSVALIEEAALGFEAFAECLVAPLFDERMGLVPCLYYVLKPGHDFKRKLLMRQLKQRLPANHLPTQFIAVSALPRNASGKLNRRDLPSP